MEKKALYTTREFAVRLTVEQLISTTERELKMDYFSVRLFGYYGREDNTPQWVERLVRLGGQYFDAIILARPADSADGWDIIGTDSDVSNATVFISQAIKRIERAAWDTWFDVAWPGELYHEKREQLGNAICDILESRTITLKKEITDLIQLDDYAVELMEKKKAEVEKWLHLMRPELKHFKHPKVKRKINQPTDTKTLEAGEKVGRSFPLFRYSGAGM